ncbi:MAG TPA: PCRF domain-containing protein, partial [Chloroflexi bacterium]|nr:PCRF domain-containing protein [Chloroflexota bacterium]
MRRQSAEPGFWDNPDNAQKTMQELAALEADVTDWQELRSRVVELAELLDLVEDDDEDGLIDEITRDTTAAESRLKAMRLRLMMSGPHDSRDAILTVYAGAGG